VSERTARRQDERGLNKSQKFVRLLELLQQPGGIAVDELMARFDLDDRTLRRYLADLRELGLPLNDQGRGAQRRVWLDASYRRQGVQLSLLEYVSLHFGRSLFAFLEGTQLVADLDDALERLSWLRDAAGVDLTADLDRKFMAVPEHAKDYSLDAERIDEVLTALLRQNPVRALYARLHGPVRTYRLHPYTLATYRQGLYLFALDVDEDKVKTFALDRFRALERLRGEHFTYPADFRPERLVQDAFGIIGGRPVDVQLRFRRAVAPYIRERRWHDSQRITECDDGSVHLHMRVGFSPELVRWIMGFGPDVQVLAPDDLALHVRQLLRDAAAAAHDPSDPGPDHPDRPPTAG
jgi:predicted DNA-binding transcriptional regulator YafY